MQCEYSARYLQHGAQRLPRQPLRRHIRRRRATRKQRVDLCTDKNEVAREMRTNVTQIL